MNKYQKSLNNICFYCGHANCDNYLNPKVFEELDIIKELVDKTKPMKPIIKVHKGSFDPISFYHCSICDFNDVEDMNYCPNCGQALECVKYEKDNL